MKKPLMFISRQKINFVLHVFLEILRRYCKFILSTLGMTGYAHAKWYYQLVGNFCLYLQAKNSTSSLMIFWRYCRDMKTSYFQYFGHDWLCTHKLIVMIKFFKKSKNSILGPFWSLFAQIWAKMTFPEKKGSVKLNIKYSYYLTPCKKLEKN